MRFIWLAITIITPLIFAEAMDSRTDQPFEYIYWGVLIGFLVVSISLTVAEFVKHRNRERHAEQRKLLQERDEDIARWRRAFFEETADLYDAQKIMLTKADELGRHQESLRSGQQETGASVASPS